ncbi:MAG: tetratricopeptide repeat protein, partial [Bacteroidota bacterium]
MKIKITCLLMLIGLALFGQQDTSTIAAQLAKGLQLKEEGNFSEAISILDSVATDLKTQANWEKYIETKVTVIYAHISMDSLGIAQQLIDQLTEEGNQYLTEPHHQLLNIQEAQVILYRTSGLYEKGMASAKKVIEERKLLFDETHPSLYKMYRELGRMHNDLSDYEVAIDYLKKGLFIIEKQYGKNHEIAAELYRGIGTNYAYKGKPAEAIPFYEKALKVNQVVYGSQSLQAANAYVMMGSIFCRIEQCSKGERNLLKALAIYKAILGEDSYDVGVAYLNLSTFYYYVPDYEKMLLYANKAVGILQQSSRTNNTNLVYA